MGGVRQQSSGKYSGSSSTGVGGAWQIDRHARVLYEQIFQG